MKVRRRTALGFIAAVVLFAGALGAFLVAQPSESHPVRTATEAMAEASRVDVPSGGVLLNATATFHAHSLEDIRDVDREAEEH